MQAPGLYYGCARLAWYCSVQSMFPIITQPTFAPLHGPQCRLACPFPRLALRSSSLPSGLLQGRLLFRPCTYQVYIYIYIYIYIYVGVSRLAIRQVAGSMDLSADQSQTLLLSKEGNRGGGKEQPIGLQSWLLDYSSSSKPPEIQAIH